VYAVNRTANSSPAQGHLTLCSAVAVTTRSPDVTEGPRDAVDQADSRRLLSAR